jgi:hypothetical protein
MKKFKERYSRKQQIGIGVLGVLELSAKVAAARDIRRRPNDQIRGSKWAWRMALLVNTVGPLGYFLLGRRRAA